MGYMAHHTVIVTASGYVMDRPGLLPDIEGFKANLPQPWPSLIVGPFKGIVNDIVTWVFLPDGSKEGWPESDAGDRFRRAFADLFAVRYDDGSTPFDVAVSEIRYGGDEPEKMSVRDPRSDWREIMYEDGRDVVRRVIPGHVLAPQPLPHSESETS